MEIIQYGVTYLHCNVSEAQVNMGATKGPQDGPDTKAEPPAQTAARQQCY